MSKKPTLNLHVESIEGEDKQEDLKKKYIYYGDDIKIEKMEFNDIEFCKPAPKLPANHLTR